MEDGEFGFAASGTHLATGPQGRVWIGTGGKVSRVHFSPDYGTSWQSFSTPMIAGGSSRGIFSLAFRNAHEGIAVGGDYTLEAEGRRNAMATTDGGMTWHLLETSPDQSVFPFRSCVGYVPDSEVVITVGPEGCNVSNDHGQTWRSFGMQGFHTLSIGGSLKSVWAAGVEGRVSRLQ